MGLESPSHTHTSSEKHASAESTHRRSSALGALALVTAQLIEAQSAYAAEITPAPILEHQMVERVTQLENSFTLTLSTGEEIVIPPLQGLVHESILYTPEKTPPAQLLVVIRQQHALSKDQLRLVNFPPALLQQKLSETLESQKQQYRILEKLVSNYTLDTSCVEGYTTQTDLESSALYTTNHLTERTVSEVAPYLPGSPLAMLAEKWHTFLQHPHGSAEEKISTDNAFKSEAERYVETYKYIVGGDILLASEHGIHVCPGEQQTTYDAAMMPDVQQFSTKQLTTITPNEFYQYRKVVFEDREDAAIENAVAVAKPAVAITYGANHDFRDAAIRWNITHPEHHIGLLILTPKTGPFVAALPSSPSETLRAK